MYSRNEKATINLHKLRYQRGAEKPHLAPLQWMAKRRVAELMRIFQDKYPKGLPRNKYGIKFARYVIRTMGFCSTFDRRQQWLFRYASWMTADERSDILDLPPHWYASSRLAENLGLYEADRERLEIRTIEAADVTQEQRDLINLEKDRKRQELRRRKDGATPREQSISRTKPWLDAGYRCRRTWERHGKPVASSSATSLYINIPDEVATLTQPQAPAIRPVTPSEPQVPAVAGNDTAYADPGIRPGGIRDRALRLVWSRQRGSDDEPGIDNVIPFPIKKREPMPLAA